MRIAIADAAPNMLLADPDRVRQVLLNLLSNALRPGHPVEVYLAAEPGRNANEAIRLIVTDDGTPIATEIRERLFAAPDPLDQRNAAKPADSTIGLSICRHLMIQMDGQIGCDPWRFEDGREGNASWLTLPPTTLPYGTGSGEGPPQLPAGLVAELEIPPADVPRRALPRARILLGGDIVGTAALIRTMLRREGHHVDTVPDGPGAIEAMRAIPYDLLLLDILMPWIDSKEAAEVIRALPAPACATPIIALASDISAENEATAKADGIAGVLAKPVSLPDVREVLWSHVWMPPLSLSNAGNLIDPPSELPQIAPVLSTSRIKELRATLPPATLMNAAEECLVDMDRRLPALRRSLTARSPGAISAHAQVMVGMAAIYGMTTLENRLRSIVTAARDNDFSLLGSAIVADLDNVFEQTAKALRDMLRTEMV
jgi:CheY-like chemotaxis protein